MNSPVINEYKPIGQKTIDALNWPLKATLHTVGWWQIDPKGSFFKNHIASRVVSFTTLLFSEVISVISKTALLLRDLFLVTIASGARIFRNVKINAWSDKQPKGRDLLYDIRDVALSTINIVFSPVIGLFNPFENYQYQVQYGLIPALPKIQKEQETLEIVNNYPKLVEIEIIENETLSKIINDIRTIAQPSRKSKIIDTELVGTDKVVHDNWRKKIKEIKKGPKDKRLEALNLLASEVSANNSHLKKLNIDIIANLQSKNKDLKKDKQQLKNLVKTLKTPAPVEEPNVELVPELTKKQKHTGGRFSNIFKTKSKTDLKADESSVKKEEDKKDVVSKVVSEAKPEEKNESEKLSLLGKTVVPEKKKSRLSFSFKKSRSTANIVKDKQKLLKGNEDAFKGKEDAVKDKDTHKEIVKLEPELVGNK